MIRVKGDALFALVLFGIFSFGIYRSLVMDNPYGGPNDVGAAFFPFWVCLFIQVLCLFVFVQSVAKARAEDSGTDGSAVSVTKRIVLFTGILAFLFLYILVMERLGFIASSSAFLFLVHQLLVFNETGRPSPVKGMAVSIVFFSVLSSALYFMFNTVFHLALP